MQIGEESRWIQRRVYATLVSNYLLRGMPERDAILRSLTESENAAVNFEVRFPSGEVIDLEPAEKQSSPSMDGWAPNGVPKEGASSG